MPTRKKPAELASATGPASVPNLRVMLVRDAAPATSPVLSVASDVAVLCADMAHLDREHFVVLLLDAKSRCIGRHTVAIGHLTAALVHPRELFKVALLANAAAIVCVHNHPSGDPTPSREDFDLTRRLVKAGEILSIPVNDHVVIAAGSGRYESIADRGGY